MCYTHKIFFPGKVIITFDSVVANHIIRLMTTKKKFLKNVPNTKEQGRCWIFPEELSWQIEDGKQLSRVRFLIQSTNKAAICISDRVHYILITNQYYFMHIRCYPPSSSTLNHWKWDKHWVDLHYFAGTSEPLILNYTVCTTIFLAYKCSFQRYAFLYSEPLLNSVMH